MEDRNHHKIELATWSYRAAAVVSGKPVHRRFYPPGIIGLIGTLLLHTLVLQSAFLGTRAHKIRPPEIQGPGAARIPSEVAPSETLILLDLPSASMTDKPLLEELASLGPAPRDLLVTVMSADPTPHVDIPPEKSGEEEDAETAIDSGDPAARALLFGRYTGQIDARIERAWRRPRSPVNVVADQLPDLNPQKPDVKGSAEGTFRCQVRIIQNGHGSVQEIQLLDCNGTVAWQKSLVVAILSASPLPAPPSPTVFTHALTMTFEGHAYAPGDLADDYELESKPPMLTAIGAQEISQPENTAPSGEP